VISKPRRLAGRMTEVENFNDVAVFADLVVNQNRAMGKFTHPRSLANGSTHAGKAAQQFDVVEQGTAETSSGFTVVLGDMADNFGEIV